MSSRELGGGVRWWGWGHVQQRRSMPLVEEREWTSGGVKRVGDGVCEVGGYTGKLRKYSCLIFFYRETPNVLHARDDWATVYTDFKEGFMKNPTGGRSLP
jgi:hypothetical protein